LSIVVPAVAGPFDLGTVVVRGSIKLDPITTALTVSTDPLPTILDGIPLDLRAVNVSVANPGFIFNPTNCNPLALTGTLTGGAGGSESVANTFQVTNCGRLGFAPKFTVSTPGKTSRADGAGLTAKIVYPKGAQANIAKVKVNLPKQLPSRLTTLQKACPDSTFNQSPEACPAASKVGFAKAITPILPEPLTGPAYFVSHGGAAFPDLVLALKGYGVDFHLYGSTFISKAGITSTSFKQVPDVPISSFELTLPQGPGSALAANGNLCTSKLVMPTSFIAQDGAELHQNTLISVTGCKPSVYALRHSVHGATATIIASVPSAGTLVARGSGLTRATRKLGSAGTATVKLALTGAERSFLAKHPGRSLKVAVKLRFTPVHGTPLSSAVTLLMR
jgi:hypothetical protein